MNASTEKTAIDVDTVSQAVADALAKSAEGLGGSVLTDSDDLFAEMMAEADADDIADSSAL